jgi:hypothetical protein
MSANPPTPTLPPALPVDLQSAGQQDRRLWADILYKIAAPILASLAEGRLRKNMPVRLSPHWNTGDPAVAYLEAFGRLMAGLAPWLALETNTANKTPGNASPGNVPPGDVPSGDIPSGGDEPARRRELYNWYLAAITRAADPADPDCMAWDAGPQPLVDAAYLAHAFLRAPEALWHPLPSATRARLIAEFQKLRRVKTAYNNWLLFAALVETFLHRAGAQHDPFRVDLAIRKTNEWYAGDGWHADGPRFALDYYNAYVIHPMLLDITDHWAKHPAANLATPGLAADALRRAQRHAAHLERLISPEGAYPPLGRSVTYRLAAFQPLAQLALQDRLPAGLAPAQIRCALTAVMRRMFSGNANFDENNFLHLGFTGHQPEIADVYTNTGSLYITSLVFLPLGLPPAHPFWSAPPAEWTSLKAWSGRPFPKDYAVQY